MSCSTSNTYEVEIISDAELSERFLDTFQLLSTKQKKIWEILRWFSIHYRQVFISHETLAEKAGCDRRTVIRAIKKFTECNWIAV
jgi:CRP-like cAMP-binding protein